MAPRKLLAITALLASSFTFSSGAHASMVAVFGDNSIDDFLNANGHTATLVSDADLATAGFLSSFDLFVYTRDDASFGSSLSAAAAANVSAFVTGNVVLFASDLADNGFPGDATDTLMLNAVSFASNKGFIGEFTGSCAAMSSNSAGLTALGLVSGTCDALGLGPGGDPMDILDTGHPVVAGVPDPSFLGGSHAFFALLSGVDSSLIVAVNSREIPSIVASARRSVPAPASLALLGTGLIGLAGLRCKHKVA